MNVPVAGQRAGRWVAAYPSVMLGVFFLIPFAIMVVVSFFERVEGEFTLRRGFAIPPSAKCLMVEDVVTTGLSSRECIAAAIAHGADVVAGCCLVDRSAGKADIGVPLIALAALDVPAYSPDDLPESLKAIPPVKPGSRGLK